MTMQAATLARRPDRGDFLPEATACPSSVVADTIMRTIELRVTTTDAAVDEKATTIFYTPVARDPRCPDCGREGRYRDTVTRPLTDLPVAGYPLVLRVAVPRYRCDSVDCGRAVFNQNLGKLAAPRSIDDAALCPVCVAPVDGRPHHHLGRCRRAGCLLAPRSPAGAPSPRTPSRTQRPRPWPGWRSLQLAPRCRSSRSRTVQPPQPSTSTTGPATPPWSSPRQPIGGRRRGTQVAGKPVPGRRGGQHRPWPRTGVHPGGVNLWGQHSEIDC